MINSLAETETREAADAVLSRISHRPSVALILGSGLGEFAKELKNSLTIDSREIPHYPRSSVEGHSGKLVFGTVADETRNSPSLLVFQGRIHFYESGKLSPVIFPVRLAHLLGARTLIVTNAAGGIRKSLRPGDFMLLEDLLSLTFLGGPTSEFPALHDLPRHRVSANPFDAGLQQLFVDSAGRLDIPLPRGVYCWLKGPTYETAAEIEMLGRCGADAVGMSTVPEIVMAAQLGMRVAAISLISNMATGIATQKLSHGEVTETADRVKPVFTALMKEVLLQIT